jgi:ribosomal protein S18 acetylase RimI-like enzyme
MNKKLLHRLATMDDAPILAKMNRELTKDENHRNRFMPYEWFLERMISFLRGDYQAILFERNGKIVAYALYRNLEEHEDTIYLRQIYVDRAYRRQGIGRSMMQVLMKEYWPENKRLTVEVLSANKAAYTFYKSVGYQDYSIELEIKSNHRK